MTDRTKPNGSRDARARRLLDEQLLDEQLLDEQWLDEQWLEELREARRAERVPEAARARLLQHARHLSRSPRSFTDCNEPARPGELRAVEPSEHLARGVPAQVNDRLNQGDEPNDDGRHPRETARTKNGALKRARRSGLERTGGGRGRRRLVAMEGLPPDAIPPDVPALLGARGLFGAESHPLLGRLAGAVFAVGVVVLVIADVRRPSTVYTPPSTVRGPYDPANVPALAPADGAEGGAAPSVARPTGLPAEDDEPVDCEPLVSASAPSASMVASGGIPSGAVSSGAVSSGAVSSGAVSPAAVSSAAVSPAVTAPPVPASAAQRVTLAVPRVSGAESSQPAAGALGGRTSPPGAALPWRSPSAALLALRSLATPYLTDDSNYPRDARVIARGNVSPERVLPERVSSDRRRNRVSNNLIGNGDFSQGDVMWSVRSWRGFGDMSVAAYYSVRAGALCTALERNVPVIGGWPWDDRGLSPSSFELVQGQRYRLSLRVWSSEPELELIVKVGHQSPPYSPALVARLPLDDEPGLFDIDFVARRHDDSAGFAFVATSARDTPIGEFCIDDVSLRPLEAGG